MKNKATSISEARLYETVKNAQKACEDNYSESRLRAMEKADIAELRMNRLQSSGIDSVIPRDVVERIACDEYDETENAMTVLSWLCHIKPFLILSGSIGRGKTVAAAIVLAKRSGLYLSASNAENVFAARYGPLVDQQEFILTRRMLVIDDVGTERDPKGFTATFERIVDSRQGRHYKTLVTSNLSKPKIFERYPDQRLIDRLNASALFVADVGDSMRNK